MATNTDGQGNPSDIEIFLVHGSYEAVVSPYGASLRGYYERRPDGSIREIVTRYAGAVSPRPPERARPLKLSSFEVGQKMGGQGDVLIPFPGRIKDGTYTFEGKTYQLDRNDKDGPNAIHGFLRSVAWQDEELDENTVRFTRELHASDYAAHGYPFSIRAQVSYGLNQKSLTCSFTMENIGDGAAPVAAGFHPYFTTGSAHIDSNELHVPKASLLEFDGLIPTGNVIPVDGTPLDFKEPRTINGTVFNNCYLHPQRDPDGLARIRMRNPETGRSVVVWLDKAFDFVVLYSGDPLPPEHRRRALAIEPMTCGSDAFNHPEWGLVMLQPGGKVSGAWGVSEE